MTLRIAVACLAGVCALSARAIQGHGAQAAESQADAAIVEIADRLITAALEKDRIPGAAFVLVRNGRTIAAKGYGVTDLERNRPVSADTVFRIGSITKVLTALGVMQLHEAGKLDIEDDVNRHLTQLQVTQRFPEPVRIRHLLTHTAGFDQRFMAREGARASDRFSLATFLQNNLHVIRPPGEFASYDTYGMTLAGHLVEQVSGIPYDVYVRRRFFEPLGMTRSSIGDPGPGNTGDVAMGYRVDGEQLKSQAWEYHRTVPASSANSTAADMGRLIAAVLNEGRTESGSRVWSEDTGRRIQQPQYENGPGGGFAYGFWDEARHGVRGVFHRGTMLGYEAQLYIVPELETGFFVAYNREGRPYPALRDELTAAILQELDASRGARSAQTEPPSVAAHDEVPTEEFAGVYADATYCHTCFENESEGGMSAFPVEAGGKGVLRFWGGRWVAAGPLEFAEEGGERRASFHRSEDGALSHFAISHRTYEKLTERLVRNVAGAMSQPGKVHPFAARVYRLTQEAARAADAYASLLELRPWDGVLHHYHGMMLIAAGRHEEAATALERAAACEQWPAPTYYLLATAYAGAGRSDRALDALERAIASGFHDADRLEEDRAFTALMGTARFTELIGRLRQGRQ